jgi:hypothetical protein
MARRRRSIFEGGSTVELDNIGRLMGDRSKPYRKKNGQYDKDSNHEPEFFNW